MSLMLIRLQWQVLVLPVQDLRETLIKKKQQRQKGIVWGFYTYDKSNCEV